MEEQSIKGIDKFLFHVDKGTFQVNPKARLRKLKRRKDSLELKQIFVDTIVIGVLYKKTVDICDCKKQIHKAVKRFFDYSYIYSQIHCVPITEKYKNHAILEIIREIYTKMGGNIDFITNYNLYKVQLGFKTRKKLGANLN